MPEDAEAAEPARSPWAGARRPDAGASAFERELAAEQDHVDRVYDRLEAMRDAARRVADTFRTEGAGGTHQARWERDVALEATRRRLAALDVGGAPLCFGRLDRHDGVRWYIGRIGVDDEEHVPLLVDWRAPIAEPFYRATAVDPMGVVRRRHLLTRHGCGRQVIGLDDEVFDQRAAAALGLSVVGEGALFAALERQRTGRMADIVATIQAAQDEAVRAPLEGILVVTGGPGTGKTAVALHRAAYLLYTHRRRLAGRGVLFLGPTPVFLRYVEHVLPSLGEQDAQLTTVRGLRADLKVDGDDPPAVAALKGDARMATVLARALHDRQRAPSRPVVLMVDGVRLRVPAERLAGITARARRARGPHNARRPTVERRLLDELVAAYRRAHPSVSATRLAEVRGRLRADPQVRAVLERCWPVLTGVELVRDLTTTPALLASAAAGVLDPAEQRLLRRPRAASLTEQRWSSSDVAMIDEADALCGPPDAARGRRRPPRSETPADADAVVAAHGLGGLVDPVAVAARYAGGTARGPGDEEPRTYGHVLVDEAQDLTPMEWRMVSRRCPAGSMTLVGDLGQATRPGAAASWDEVFAALATRRGARTVALDVNYRTPAEIMDLAGRLLPATVPGSPPGRSVRRSGRPPRRCRSDDPVGTAAAVAGEARAEGGTVVVVAPLALHRALVDALGDLGAVAGSPDALDAPVGVLDAPATKGLEFDHVVVVEPADLVTGDARGLRLLYVVCTRATRSLTIVHRGPLPGPLAPPGSP